MDGGDRLMLRERMSGFGEPGVDDDAGRMTGRHVMVLLAGVLICLGPCALVYNTWSIFVVPVADSLGAASSQFTLFITIIYLIGAIASPFAGNLMERLDLRIVLTASVVLVAAGMFLCSVWTQVWQFYVSGVIEGLGIVSLMFLAVPTLVNRWFTVRTGFFIGLCFAMSGIGGALWSMVGGALLSAFDWRMAYLVFSVVVLATGLPATLVLIRSHPEEVGLVAYGSGRRPDDTPSDIPQADGGSGADERQWGVSARVMFRSPAFYTLMLAMGVFNALTVTGNLFASYIYHLGSLGVAGITPDGAIMLASGVAACIMIFAAIGKVVLGALSDVSLIAAFVLACGCGAASILCMWFGVQSSVYFVYAGGMLCGVLYAAVDSLSPSATRQLVGPRDYTLIYSRVAIFVNLSGAGAATLFALVAEISWEAEWIMALSLIAITFVLGVITIALSRSLEQTYE